MNSKAVSTMKRFWNSVKSQRLTESRRLNLGCGKRRHPDWVNADLLPAAADVVRVDLRRRLPFPDQRFDAVYASHVLEHLTPSEARRLLFEIRRVLSTNGVVRIVVPDLEGIVRLYIAELEAAAGGDTDARWRHRWMTVEMLDQLVRCRPGGVMARWWSCDPVPCQDLIESRLGAEAINAIADLHARRSGPAVDPKAMFHELEVDDRAALRFAASGERHKWMYDRVSLAELLLECGFQDPCRVGAGESRIPDFAGFGLDADASGTPYKPDSLFMEAIAGESLGIH